MSDRVSRRLEELERAGLRRQLRAAPGALSVSSNDYLGLATDSTVNSALVHALADFPHGATGSRLLTGHHGLFDVVERRMADWQGAPAALLYATGFAANQGLLTALIEPGDRVVSDALNHASLIDGLRLTRAERHVVPHLDLDAVASALQGDRPTWVVVESVYSMDGDLAPLAELADLCARRGAALIVDEAHATGLYGPTGAGRIEALGLRDAVFASVHTAGKALGCAGAFVVSSEPVRELQIQRARSFVFSTAPPPFLCAGLLAAIERVQEEPALRARPRELAARLRVQLQGHAEIPGGDSPIVPVVVGSVARAQGLAEGLAERGWDARPIRPPTVPEGTCRVRLVMHAGLTEAQVDQLASDVRGVLEALDA